MPVGNAPESKSKPRWQLFEDHTIVQFRQIANGNPTATDDPLVKALRGARVYGPWTSDVPAGLLASIGFLGTSTKEYHRIQHASPDKCGWAERGGDGLIVCANDWIIALQMKDVAHAGHASNLQRYLMLCRRVEKYNATLGIVDEAFAAPCGILAVAPDTRISDMDILDYRETCNILVEAMPNFTSTQPRAPLTVREQREADDYARRFANQPERNAPALPVPPPEKNLPAPLARGKIKGGLTERERLIRAERKASREAARPRKAVDRTFQDRAVKTICAQKGLHLVRGPTGCGKTTIISHVLANLLTPPRQVETRSVVAAAAAASNAAGGAAPQRPKWRPPICFLVAPFIQHARQLYDALEEVLKLRLGTGWEHKVLFLASEQLKRTEVVVAAKDDDETAAAASAPAQYQSCAVPTQGELLVSMEDLDVCVFVATDKSSELLLEVAKSAHILGRTLFVVSDEAHFDSGNRSAIMELLRMVDVDKGDTGIAASATPDGNVMALPGLKRTLQLDYDVAIKNRWIADYKIVLPLVHDVSKTLDGKPLALDVQALLGAHPEDDLGAAALFTVQGMYVHGKRRCIAYARDSRESALEAERALQQACEVVGVRCKTHVVVCGTQRIDRDAAIKDFSQGSTRVEEPGVNEFGEPCLCSKPLFRFLIGVRILDQCLDFPLCDAVAILTPPMGADSTNKSAHRAMQRLGRCLRYKFRGDTSRCYVFADPESEWLNSFLDCLGTFDSGMRARTSVVSANPDDLTRPNARAEVKRAERATVKDVMDRYEIHRESAVALTTSQKLVALVECTGSDDDPPKKGDKMKRINDDGTEEGTEHVFNYGEFLFGILGNFANDGKKQDGAGTAIVYPAPKFVLTDEDMNVAYAGLPYLSVAVDAFKLKNSTHGLENKVRALNAFMDATGRKPVAQQPGEKACKTPEAKHEQKMASFVNSLVTRKDYMTKKLGAAVYEPLMKRIKALHDAVQEPQVVADIRTVIATCVQKAGKNAPWPNNSSSRGDGRRKAEPGGNTVQSIFQGSYRYKSYPDKWHVTCKREVEASVLCQPVAKGAEDVHAKARFFLLTLIAFGRDAQQWKRDFQASEPERRARGEVDLPGPKGTKKLSHARARWFDATIRVQWVAKKLAVGIVDEKPDETPEEQAKRARTRELDRKRDAKRRRKAVEERAKAAVNDGVWDPYSDPE